MELISSIPVLGPVLAALLPFLFVLGIVVFIHEYGHYIVGRWCGIRAKVFSIGFGRPLWGWEDRHGTYWQVALIPLGGYVKFVGDMDPASANKTDDGDLSPEERAHAFHRASLWRRAATVIAGPAANFLLSIVVFAGLAMAVGQASNAPVIAQIGQEAPADLGLKAGDRVLRIDDQPIENFSDIVNVLIESNGQPLEAEIERDGRRQNVDVRYNLKPLVTGLAIPGAAVSAGVRVGDMIESIDGEPVASFRALQLLTADLPPGKEIALGVRRGGVSRDIYLIPELVEKPHPRTGLTTLVPTLGVQSQDYETLIPQVVGVGPVEAVTFGTQMVGRIIRDTLVYVREMVFNNADTSQLSGPIGIAKVSGDAAAQGLAQLIRLIAFISTAIGLINLFPIPVLDGGHLMFYAFEALRGRPLGDNWMRISSAIGLSLVLLLMAFVMYNDITQL